MNKHFAFVTFLFILLLLVGVTTSKAFAQEQEQTITPEPTSVETQNQATPSPTIKYDLAYPGILPDTPLYKLKVLRDKIIIGFINEPLKKIEFYLLQADKGILASAMLVDKKEMALAAETALKAENNFTLLTQELPRYRKKLGSDFYNKLKRASLKHQEVLLSLAKRAPKKEKKTFEIVADFSKRNWETVEKYQKRELVN